MNGFFKIGGAAADTTPAKLAGFLLFIYSTSHRKQQTPHAQDTARTGQYCKNFENKIYTPEPTDKSAN